MSSDPIFFDGRFEADYRRDPLTVVDVGASGGMTNISEWNQAARHLRVIGFEADERGVVGGTENKTYLHKCLYKEKASLPFYFRKKQAVSSIFKPNYSFLKSFPMVERFELTREARVEADTLDAQLKEAGVSGVDFIKLDTEGSELFILQGASRTLTNDVFGVLVEVEFARIYEDQPLFSDVDPFLRGFDLEIFDLKLAYWKRAAGIPYGGPKGQLNSGDALYLKSLPGLKRMVDAIGTLDAKRSKVLNCLSICAIYGYLDYASEIASAHADLFTKEEGACLDRFFKASIPLSRRIGNRE